MSRRERERETWGRSREVLMQNSDLENARDRSKEKTECRGRPPMGERC